MNEAHWHLALNHLPIVIPMMGLLIILGGIFLKSEILKRAAYCLFILAALTAIAASSTGEGAEEIVEEIGGIDEQFIKIHEETSEVFSIILYLLGGLSMVGLWLNLKGSRISNFVAYVSLSLGLVGLFYAKQTATTGGEIRHTEIRNANPSLLYKNNEREKEDND